MAAAWIGKYKKYSKGKKLQSDATDAENVADYAT